jgi:putative endonuclease
MWNYNFFVYIVTNPDRNALYIGVTNDLKRRLDEHYANKGNPVTFAGRYHCYRLVYYERFTNIEHAIEREKELKKWSREKKLNLIRSVNPDMGFLNHEVDPD